MAPGWRKRMFSSNRLEGDTQGVALKIGAVVLCPAIALE
jgi:hypothetical protein